MFTFGPNSFNMNAKYMIKPFFFHFWNIWLRSQTATLTPFGNTVRGGADFAQPFTTGTPNFFHLPAGMREGGLILPLAFQYLILMIWRDCDLNWIMISLLAWKQQDFKLRGLNLLIVLIGLSWWPKESKFVLKFAIAWWKQGQKVYQTHKQTWNAAMLGR